jgi:hypothetical protein
MQSVTIHRLGRNGVLAAVLASLLPAAALAETVFPPRSRTLLSPSPGECRNWQPPLPELRHAIELDRRGPPAEGSAELMIRIGRDGRFLDLVSARTNDARFVEAAVDSFRRWTFQPARCNGQDVEATATVFLEFRRAPAVAVVR